jgi:hypothetical protein
MKMAAMIVILRFMAYLRVALTSKTTVTWIR